MRHDWLGPTLTVRWTLRRLRGPRLGEYLEQARAGSPEQRERAVALCAAPQFRKHLLTPLPEERTGLVRLLRALDCTPARLVLGRVVCVGVRYGEAYRRTVSGLPWSERLQAGEEEETHSRDHQRTVPICPNCGAPTTSLVLGDARHSAQVRCGERCRQCGWIGPGAQPRYQLCPP